MKIDSAVFLADLREVPRLARYAEDLGYDGLWTAEAGHDPYLPVALAATATERVTLGTNIAVAFPRSPLVHAQIGWDLQAASRGRFVLGLGTQVKGHNERRYSTPWLPPGPRLREMIQLIRHIWDVWQHGKKPGFQGKYYQFSLMTPFFSPASIEWPHIPIYIAAVNPYMCRLVGELCDGIQVHPFHSTKYIRETVLANVEQGLAKSGRKRSDVTFATSAFVIAGKDRDEVERVRASVRQQIAFYASTRTYIGVLEAHGLITDEMLAVYAVEGSFDDVPGLLKKKYGGLIDRLSFYTPLRPGEDDATWRRVIAACRS
ncbi:MAG: TIGR03617 family F420-dependent LLM class oxidoreductase [Deltaproteobacteria bacterium]|nr:MAG: TIGR03617 family F420-dependent LLM class oxidoreductase [Deltaproteobacteria bacterium]